MMVVVSEEEMVLYRLLLVDPRDRTVLAEWAGTKYCLPVVSVLQNARPAEMLTAITLERWRLQTVVIDWLKSADESPNSAVLEILPQTSRSVSGELSFISIDRVDAEMLPPDHLTLAQRMLAGESDDRGPFSRFGWAAAAEQWIRESVEDPKLYFTDIRQLNAGGSFALARFRASSGQAYWLKAVGAPNAHEFLTTSYLAGRYSEYLPKLVATRTDWNAWVMEEFGESLRSRLELAQFERAAKDLARLQRRTRDDVDGLLAAGFVDHRVEALDRRVDETFAFLDQAMRLQTSRRSQPMTPERLREVAAIIRHTCGALNDLNLPDTVIHSDISPGSILSKGNGCTFIDWCEAYVGVPFISFEQLSIQAVRVAPDSKDWIHGMRSAYCAEWIDLLSADQMKRAFLLTPLVSAFSYLLGRGDWLYDARSKDPAVQSYSRSLARQMDRLASDQSQLEVL